MISLGNEQDWRDRLVFMLVGGGFIASWVYVFVHASDAAFGICVGGVGTFTAAFHWFSIKDDKIPDQK